MSKSLLLRFCVVVLPLVAQLPLIAADFYVAPTGSDSNSGAKDSPFQSISAARDAVREVLGKQKVTIHLADGIYYLPETLVFTPADSGTEEFPVIYRALNEGKAVVSGGTKLKLNWRPYRDGIFQAATPPSVSIDQLFINGVRQRMARYPNYDATKMTAAYQGYAGDAFSIERAAGWANPTGGFIHAMHRNRWGGYHYRITGKKPDGEVAYEGGWQNNRRMGMHKEFRMVENIFEELDAPGEWFHDAKQSKLYYKPETGVELENATIEVVRLRHLVEIQGSEAHPVQHITLQGFVIRHAARTFMETKEPLLRSDWAIYRGGAFMITGAEDISILDTEFDQVGGNAVFFSDYCRRVRVKGCHIHDVGGNGICFVGDPNAVRDPLFQYREKNDLTKIDRTPGPKTNNYPARGIVEDCLIHGIGRVERQPAGVQISMSMDITVRDTSVYDCARAGINIGDGCWGGHLIEHCDVFDTVLETHDHGSFNSWGRDRFWHSNRSVSQVAVDAEPDLPFLDAVKTTVIRNSRWRCDHGWDIDLDDGSSNYDIYNNLMLRGGLKLREGFRRRAWNNITVNNGFHPHVWYNHSQDEVFSNIFMAAARGARMPSETAKGKRVDGNLFFVEEPSLKDRFTQFGWDVNSIAADPMFVDPKNGDFRVAEGSPAFEIGFENFPMDQFGVKKPALKAIARTPDIPEIEPAGRDARTSQAPVQNNVAELFWLGAQLHELSAEEYSAYGVRRDDGGVALDEVPKASAAARHGLLEGDLIQAVSERKVTGSKQLLGLLCELRDQPLRVKVIRNQQAVVIDLSSIPYVKIETFDSAANPPSITQLSASSNTVTANQQTGNQPLRVLVDGQLQEDYGPVFRNGVTSGAYKIDLGKSRSVTTIRSWSFNESGKRGAQRVTLYGSQSTKDPGWTLTDREHYTPIGSIDTTRSPEAKFHAVALVAPQGKILGKFRWIVWRTSPVTNAGENTAFQELSVEVSE